MKIWGFSCEGFLLGHWGENSGIKMENPMKMRPQVCWGGDGTRRHWCAWERSQQPKWRAAVEGSQRATVPPSPSACWQKCSKASSLPSLLTHLPGFQLTFQSPADPPGRASYTSNNITSIQSYAVVPSPVRGREKGEVWQGTFFIAFSRFKY